MKDLLETANLDIYLTLIKIFKYLNKKKAHHTPIFDERCLVEYPPIADFFRACCGTPVYGDYSFIRYAYRFHYQINEKGEKNKQGKKKIHHKKVYYKLTLISTELPELIQSYVNFDLREDVRWVLNNDKFKQSEPILKNILEHLGYEVEVKRTFENGYNTIWKVNPQEEKEIERNDVFSNEVSAFYLYFERFRRHLKEYTKFNSKSLRLCLIHKEKDENDYPYTINEEWSDYFLVVKNPQKNYEYINDRDDVSFNLLHCY